MSRQLEFYLFHNGAYRWAPHKDLIGEWSRSNFVSLPTSFYKPEYALRAMDEWLETNILAEKLGYDGVVVGEQHNGPIGLSGNPMVITSWLAANTERLLIAAVGPLLNAYLSPLRLAEEIAIVDILSRGRLILGLPMGIGGQYHSVGVMDPTHARTRFREAHDLMFKAMTEPGPFEWQGDYFHVPYVNLWPRPLQQPHPPVWIPAAGSRETLQLCARRRYTYQSVLTPRSTLSRNCVLFRELCAEEGYETAPEQIAYVVIVHVAETDRQARLEAEPHVMWLYQNFFRSTFQDSFPPGHVSIASLRGMAAGGGYRSRDISEMTWEELWDEGWIVAGSPSTVVERLEELTDEFGAGRIVMIPDMGSAPSWMVKKNLTLCAEEVLPRFRAPGAGPVWAREDRRAPTTWAQWAAAGGEPKATPEARVEGDGVLDVRTAHVQELREPTRE
ncbi:MAG TPA: LLM class flavin-dependent oxidoreductase [Solirubrobacteraceae bacterium]|nr:LLM class flavin-dependent oxidoreductase [Solirubrobacteraceae bacterium]